MQRESPDAGAFGLRGHNGLPDSLPSFVVGAGLKPLLSTMKLFYQSMGHGITYMPLDAEGFRGTRQPEPFVVDGVVPIWENRTHRT